MTGKSFVVVLFLLFAQCDGERKWDYELISADSKTTDKTKLDCNLKIKRTLRGEYTLNGFLNFEYDIDESSKIEEKTYISQSGEEKDYRLTPWMIPKIPFNKFIEDMYKVLIYNNWGSCTSLPHPDEALPWKRGNYTINNCAILGDGMPEIVAQGYYKVFLLITGEVDWSFEIVAKIFDKFIP